MKINHGFERISSCPKCRVKAAGLFEAGISDKARTEFVRMTQVRRYMAGEILFGEGSQPTGVFLVDTGRVKLARHADARLQVVKIARAGDVLGLGATVTRRAHGVTAETLSETQVRFLPALDFHRFLKRRPPYIGHLVTYIEDHAHGDNAPFVLTTASRRVAAFLLQSAHNDGHPTSEGTCVELPVTVGELSAVLFVRGERIEDVFERFEDFHWIYRGERNVTLLDESALEAISHGYDGN